MNQTHRLRRALISGLGGALGIALMIALAGMARHPLTSIGFVTSIVLVMAAPESPQTQPRNILVGHVLSAICGLAVAAVGGTGPASASIAVGLAIFGMHMTRCIHPPAGINAYFTAGTPTNWVYLINPVTLGAVILIAYAFVYHRVLTGRDVWPRRWV